jgi:hypothetical protein
MKFHGNLISFILVFCFSSSALQADNVLDLRTCQTTLKKMLYRQDYRAYEAVQDDPPILFQAPDRGCAYGVSACLAVGIIDFRNRLGYVGHNSMDDTGMFHLILETALASAKRPADLRMVFAGRKPLTLEQLDYNSKYFSDYMKRHRAQNQSLIDYAHSLFAPSQFKFVFPNHSEDLTDYTIIVDPRGKWPTLKKEPPDP